MKVKKVLAWGCGGYLALGLLSLILMGGFSLFKNDIKSGISSRSTNDIKSGISSRSTNDIIQKLDYRAACELKDFETAYQIVDKLKEETSEAKIKSDDNNSRGSYWAEAYRSGYQEAKKKSDEAEKYVVLHESMLVLESQGSDGLNRIIAIAKEHNLEWWLYTEMADLAKKLGNADLEEKFKNILSNTDVTIDDIENIALIKYLAETKNKSNSEKILGLLAKEEKNIPTRPALGLYKSEHEDRPFKEYNESIKDYNDACQTILDIAIIAKNQYLAQRVITKAKPCLAYKDLGDWVRVVEKHRDWSSIYEAYKLSLDNSNINSIKAAYQEAVRSGAFR